jgi:hypothetical protein
LTVAGWRLLPQERIALYSPIGLRLVDDFTGRGPLGRVTARLDRQVSVGVWSPTDIGYVATESGILVWPGLGREWEPGSAPTRRYRARVEADLYRPEYLQNADGIEFNAPPWDDHEPPSPMTSGSQDLYLFPEVSYDFPTWVRVLRGVVEDSATGDPVANVLVHQAAAERVLTDERGAFTLPLRWANNGDPLDAVDIRTGHVGSHVLNLPADLQSSVTITIA